MLKQSNLVKVDPTKLREVLNASKGRLSVGSWRAYGEKRAEEATESALSRVFPRVDDYGNVTSAIISICGSPDMTMNEYGTIVKKIIEKLPDNASVLMEVNAVEIWHDSIQVTVLLGGVQQD
jgi:cell division protein FtsZ